MGPRSSLWRTERWLRMRGTLCSMGGICTNQYLMSEMGKVKSLYPWIHQEVAGSVSTESCCSWRWRSKWNTHWKTKIKRFNLQMPISPVPPVLGIASPTEEGPRSPPHCPVFPGGIILRRRRRKRWLLRRLTDLSKLVCFSHFQKVFSTNRQNISHPLQVNMSHCTTKPTSLVSRSQNSHFITTKI